MNHTAWTYHVTRIWKISRQVSFRIEYDLTCWTAYPLKVIAHYDPAREKRSRVICWVTKSNRYICVFYICIKWLGVSSVWFIVNLVLENVVQFYILTLRIVYQNTFQNACCQKDELSLYTTPSSSTNSEWPVLN